MFKIKIFLTFFCAMCFNMASAAASSLIIVSDINWSKTTESAVEQWVSEIGKMPNIKNIYVLVKEGGDEFTQDEWSSWLVKNSKYGLDPKKSWDKDAHGSKVIWSDNDGIGCVVIVPQGTEYSHKYGKLPMQWVIWHELSHCVWSFRDNQERWLTIPNKSILANDIRLLEEESWADGWALSMSKKYLKIESNDVYSWMRSRTDDAKKCKCLDHWTNATLFQINGMMKNDEVWETMHFVTDEVFMDVNEFSLIKNSLKIAKTKTNKPQSGTFLSWVDENVKYFQATSAELPLNMVRGK